MKWQGEFRAPDRGLGILLSGKMAGEFRGTCPEGTWGKLRVAIINSFNEVVAGSDSTLKALRDLSWVSSQITASLGPLMHQLGASGEVVVEVTDLDESSKALVDERKIKGPSAPDAFVIGMAPKKAGFSRGDSCLVQWSDGNRYPARVVQTAPDQYLVELGDGRQIWVGAQWVYRA